MTTISAHDDQAIEAFFRGNRIDPHRLKRFRFLLYSERRPMGDLLAELPEAAARAFEAHFRLPWLHVDERRDSAVDQSTKIVFRTPDDRLLETVILRASGGRTSLCVSSQIGCAANCSFCATARMGLVRNLATHELIAQVAQANDLLRSENRRVRNVVFMGMGEPFHNEEAVCDALRRLIDVQRFAFSPRRVLVSTVGIPDAMIRFARAFPLVGLAISLHSTIPAQREALIPLARRYPLDELRLAMGAVQSLQRRPLMVEYLMIEAYNDDEVAAVRLGDFLRGLWVHVNLIPYNATLDGPADFRPSPLERRDRFARLLRERGLLTTIRNSLGSDIGAACGQLVQPPSSARSASGG